MTTDRTTAPDDTFEARLIGWELRSEVDIAADVAVERVAQAMWVAEQDDYCGTEHCCTWDSIDGNRRDGYRRLARAALAAMPPADEALRDQYVTELPPCPACVASASR